jgi:hypothetical protein
VQGVTPGTIISFYDKSVSRFDGGEKIASGSVISVTPLESTVRLISPRREVTVADKAVVISADLGSLRLQVNLDLDAAKLSAAQKNVIANVKSALTERPVPEIQARGVDVASPLMVAAGGWDVAVLRDKFSKVASKSPGGLAGCEPKTPDADVLYLAGKDFVPLYQFCIDATFPDQPSQAAAANRIEDALIHISRLRSIIALSNKRSALKGKVTVRVIRLSGSYACTNSKFTATQITPAVIDPRSGNYPFTPGDVFWFEITNNASDDLYLALLDLPPDGSVKISSPRERDEEKGGVTVAKNGGKRIVMSERCRVDSAGDILEAGAFRITPGAGLERFKLIASTQSITRDDFAYLAMPRLNRTGNSSLEGKSDWTTIETILQINDTRN